MASPDANSSAYPFSSQPVYQGSPAYSQAGGLFTPASTPQPAAYQPLQPAPQPTYVQPTYVQPAYVQPAYVQPAHDPSASGPPPYSQQPYGGVQAPLPGSDPYVGSSIMESQAPNYNTPTFSEELAAPGCLPYGDECVADGGGVFFSYDYLYWMITPPDTTTVGGQDYEGYYNQGGVLTYYENHLDTSFIDEQFHSAHRFEFGNVDCNVGWLANISFGRNGTGYNGGATTFLPDDPDFSSGGILFSGLAGFADGNGDGIDDDVNGNNIFGRHGEDLGTPGGMGGFAPPFDGTIDAPAATDTGDLVIWIPEFTSIELSNLVEFQNLELMSLRRWYRGNGSFDFLYGIRYFDLTETFSFSGTGGILDRTSFKTVAENQIFGIQVGGRWQGCLGRWRMNVDGRFLAAANMQDVRLEGNVASNISSNVINGQNGPANLSPSAFRSQIENNEFTPMGELRLEAIYPINSWLSFKAGYTGILIDGISRASTKVDYTLPRFQLANRNSDELVGIHAATFGLEINR